MLEYNYLSSPKKLIEYQKKYFDNELVEADIESFNWINIENSWRHSSRCDRIYFTKRK